MRIDSGDLADHAKKVRRILDDAGLQEIGIFASGSLDEYALADLLGRGAPIDGFGVGTSLTTSSDLPTNGSIDRRQVESADEMQAEVDSVAPDVAVMAAAVADFKPDTSAVTKLARADGPPEIVYLEPYSTPSR